VQAVGAAAAPADSVEQAIVEEATANQTAAVADAIRAQR
jgi:hypothetical protein